MRRSCEQLRSRLSKRKNRWEPTPCADVRKVFGRALLFLPSGYFYFPGWPSRRFQAGGWKRFHEAVSFFDTGPTHLFRLVEESAMAKSKTTKAAPETAAKPTKPAKPKTDHLEVSRGF